jgi:hypothetical protein
MHATHVYMHAGMENHVVAALKLGSADVCNSLATPAPARLVGLRPLLTTHIATTLVQADDEEVADLCDELGIEVIPTLQFWRNGAKIWEHKGIMNMDQVGLGPGGWPGGRLGVCILRASVAARPPTSTPRATMAEALKCSWSGGWGGWGGLEGSSRPSGVAGGGAQQRRKRGCARARGIGGVGSCTWR